MADCIPIHYAPDRAWGKISILRALSELANENTLPVNVVKNILVAGGWSVVDTRPASGTLFFLLGLPAWNLGISQNAMTFQGLVYTVYDPFAGHGPGAPNQVWVPEGATSNDTLDTLCIMASGSDYNWRRLDSQHILVTASTTNVGTAGNGQVANGQFGASCVTSNGGWVLQSQSANSTSHLFITVTGGGFETTLNLAVDLDIGTITGVRRTNFGLGDLFSTNSYTLFANSYQLVVFQDGVAGPVMITSAPYVIPAFVSTLGYTALAGTGRDAVLGDPLGYQTSLAQGNTTLAMDGLGGPSYTASPRYRTSQPVDFGLIARYPDSVPLLIGTNGGKTIATESMMTLPDASANPMVIGALWDTFVESKERVPETDTIEYDGKNWRVLLTQGGGNGGFNSRTSGTLWIARPESGPIIS